MFLLVMAFLLGGILLTLWLSAGEARKEMYTNMVFGDDAATTTMTAEVITEEDKRESRLASLRAKLARYTDVAMAPSPEEVPVADNSDSATTTTSEPVVAAATLCANYGAASVPQLNGQLVYQTSGSQRTFAKQEIVPAVSTTSSSTVTMTTVFTLPLRTAPLPNPACIQRDIVAVTPTGAPIRNSDYAKYKGSGEATLIGYTIDGFELYGQSSSLATDACGGTTVSGTYRYYLSSERNTIINCFAAIPVAL